LRVTAPIEIATPTRETLAFRFSLRQGRRTFPFAAGEGRRRRAAHLIRRAQQRGFAPEEIAKLLQLQHGGQIAPRAIVTWQKDRPAGSVRVDVAYARDRAAHCGRTRTSIIVRVNTYAAPTGQSCGV